MFPIHDFYSGIVKTVLDLYDVTRLIGVEILKKVRCFFHMCELTCKFETVFRVLLPSIIDITG